MSALLKNCKMHTWACPHRVVGKYRTCLRVLSLLYADDVVLLTTSVCNLKQELRRFATDCDDSGWEIRHDMDRWFDAASAVMQALYQIVEVKRELRLPAQLSNYQSINIPTLIYGHGPTMDDWKKEIVDTHGWNESLKIGRGAWSQAFTPSHKKDPIGVVRAPD